MKIAIQNIHHLPQLLSRGGLNNYVLELLKQGRVDYLYFDDKNFKNIYGVQITRTINDIFTLYKFDELGLDKTEIIFSSKTLNSQVDILLNFNGVIENDMTESVKKFQGMKIFHIMDYFWVQPASVQYKKLKDMGIDYLMSYGQPDKYDIFFQSKYPDFIGKVLQVPYGYSPRFKSTIPFEERTKKCVALGSVNPLYRPEAPESFWIEPYKFFKKEKWMHKFRRMLVEKRKHLDSVMDSLLPNPPKVTDHSYNIVDVLNKYQMFTTCESIYYFPTAKSFEGPAAGCVQVCSDHKSFSDLGFIDGVNCIKHKEFNIRDFKDKIYYYQKHQNELHKIHTNGTKMVIEKYSHPAIASKLYQVISEIYNHKAVNKDKELILENTKKIWVKSISLKMLKKGLKQKNNKLRNKFISFLAKTISLAHQKIMGPTWSKINSLLSNSK